MCVMGKKMKIAPVNYSFKRKIETNFKRNNGLTNVRGNDVFIKNTNNISFQSNKMDRKYEKLSEEITDYTMNSSEIKKDKLERIVQKYSFDTEVDDLENLNTNKKIISATASYTKIPTAFYKAGNSIVAKTLPKTIYTLIPKGTNKKDRIIFTDRFLHECTHILQEESDDRISSEAFFNNHLRNSKNLDLTLKSCQATPNIFTNIESFLLESIAKSRKITSSLPKEIPAKDADIDLLYKKLYGKDATFVFANIVLQCLDRYQNGDTDLIIDYIIFKANSEKEAYQNALNSDKTLMGLNGATDFDLRINSYQKLIDAATMIKKMIKQ